MTRRDGEAAAMPVFEAVLVAVLIITTIIFFASLQRPVPPPERGGLDLSRVAADTLLVLERRNLVDPDGDGSGMLLEEWVTRALDGNETAADTAHLFVEEVLPAGTLYSLRLDNGFDQIHILPRGQALEPRGGQGAEILFLPDWDVDPMAPPDPWLAPGQRVTAASHLEAYNLTHAGFSSCVLGPAGVQYTTEWHETVGRVPDTIPGGLHRQCSDGSDEVQVSERVSVGQAVSSSTNPVANAFTRTGQAYCLRAQDESLTNATGATWTSIWQDGPDAPGKVPTEIPGGLWTGHSDLGCNEPQAQYVYVVEQPVHPGQEIHGPDMHAAAHAFLAGTGIACIKSPTGSKTGPDGGAWVDTWQAQGPVLRVPSAIPFGRWSGYDDTNCAGTPFHVQVGLDDGTATDHPVYGLQLVVWFGA